MIPSISSSIRMLLADLKPLAPAGAGAVNHSASSVAASDFADVGPTLPTGRSPDSNQESSLSGEGSGDEEGKLVLVGASAEGRSRAEAKPECVGILSSVNNGRFAADVNPEVNGAVSLALSPINGAESSVQVIRFAKESMKSTHLGLLYSSHRYTRSPSTRWRSSCFVCVSHPGR